MKINKIMRKFFAYVDVEGFGRNITVSVKVPKDTEIFEEKESNVRSYCRKYPTIFKHAKNAEMYSEDETRCIDFLSVAGSINYGHNNPLLPRKSPPADWLQLPS